MTHHKFNGISQAIDKTEDMIRYINELSEDMNDKKNKIITIIHSLYGISEENAAGTEQSSASIEQQTQTIDDIVSASEGLAKLASS